MQEGEQKQVLLDTEDMGEVESYILNLFSEGEGLYYGTVLKESIRSNFESLEENELDYYYGQFINYLLEENKLTEVLPEIFISKEHLKPDLEIPDDLLCTEIKVENPVSLSRIIGDLISNGLKLKDLSKNKLLFTDSSNYGLIFIELPDMDDFNYNYECKLLNLYFKYSNEVEKAFISFYEELRTHILSDLPKILNFENSTTNPLETGIKLFEFVNEVPVIDFKAMINYKKSKKGVLAKIQKEILKDIIALGNSSFLFGNSAYYVIGVEEKDGKITKIHNVKKQDVLFQQIAFLSRDYIKLGFNLRHLDLKIYDLFKKIDNGELKLKIPFDDVQTKNTCEDKILIIQIIREPKACLEIKKDINWMSNKGVIKKETKGKSWIRIGSHTFDLLNEERKTLLLN